MIIRKWENCIVAFVLGWTLHNGRMGRHIVTFYNTVCTVLSLWHFPVRVCDYYCSEGGYGKYFRKMVKSVKSFNFTLRAFS